MVVISTVCFMFLVLTTNSLHKIIFLRFHFLSHLFVRIRFSDWDSEPYQKSYSCSHYYTTLFIHSQLVAINLVRLFGQCCCTSAVGSVQLVDVSDKLPGLVRENGVHSWRVRVSLSY